MLSKYYKPKFPSTKTGKWTLEETDLLVSLVVTGLSTDYITQRLNRTYNSVSCKISELRSNGIILPKQKRSPRITKKLRYEMDHVDSIGPLLFSEAKEVTEPLTSPVTSAYAPSKPDWIQIDAILESMNHNGYSGTIAFHENKITHIVFN
jgi:transposase